MPLGLGLGLVGRGPRVGALLGGLLSVAIETLQGTGLAGLGGGRDASLLDIVANTAGTMIGVLTVGYWTSLSQARATVAQRLAIAWAAVLFLGAPIGSLLLRPELPTAVWYGQLAPELGQYDRFTGQLRHVTLDGSPLESGPLTREQQIEVTRIPMVLEAEIVTGASTSRLAPIAAIHDATTNKVAVLGQEGTDLIWEPRIRAESFGLAAIGVRLPNVLRESRSVRVSGRSEAGALGATLEGSDSVDRVRVTLSPALAWLTLLPGSVAVGGSIHWVDLVWLIAGFIPIGFFIGRGGRAGQLSRVAAGVGLAAALLWLAPLPMGLAPLPWWCWIGPVAGTVLGRFSAAWSPR